MIAAIMNMNTYNAYGDYAEASEIYRSSDGGKTWRYVFTIHDPRHEKASWPSGDPTLVFDRHGTAYFANLADREVYPKNDLDVYRAAEGGIEVYRSTDHGKTWSKPTWAFRRVVDHAGDRCYGPDKELMTVDPRTGELLMAFTLFKNDCVQDEIDYYEGVVAEKQDIDLMLVRSRDGGRTWTKPRRLWHGYVLGAQPAVGPDGTIYVLFTSSEALGSTTVCPYALGFVTDKRPSELDVIVASSSDHGRHWRYVRRASCDPIAHPSELPRLENRAPSISVDPSDGRAYVLWSSFAPTFSIVSMTSADRGRTWSDEVPVTPPALGDALQPSVHATGGVARAIWYRTSDLGNTFDVQWAESTDHGRTWTPSRTLSLASFPGGQDKQLGDYIWIDAARGRVAAIWTDTRVDGVSDVYARVGRTR
jgi:hypothetical protein